jgi:hypothetical protein
MEKISAAGFAEYDYYCCSNAMVEKVIETTKVVDSVVLKLMT